MSSRVGSGHWGSRDRGGGSRGQRTAETHSSKMLSRLLVSQTVSLEDALYFHLMPASAFRFMYFSWCFAGITGDTIVSELANCSCQAPSLGFCSMSALPGVWLLSRQS